MKKILFIRHGKAEEISNGISDFERSLTTKGKREMHSVAERLYLSQPAIDIFFSSPAFRAIETAYIVAGRFKIKPEDIIVKDDLYYKTNPALLLRLLQTVDDDKNCVAFVGHNPSVTHLAEWFSKDTVDFIPKGGIVCISFSTKIWSSIYEDEGKLEFIVNPAGKDE